MKQSAIVSEKGQVTIPKPLRDRLGIRPGTELRFEERKGALVATKTGPVDPIEGLAGLLPRMDVDAAIAKMRGPGYHPKRDGR